jgi:predicted transposase/invertase (TIGR01784 family)
MHYMEHERAALQRGLEQGREEKAIETARTMLADGEPIDKIHKYTGLSTEEIKQL